MLCAISGEAPQVPVASSKSGAVYEKRLITAYISKNGTEPATGEELTVEDLIDLKSSRIVRPRPPTLTSIPSLLSVFQEEWDALALETYTLKENLVKTRQELSTALYQHDAAVRVIARLTKERDEARDALSKVSVGAQGAPGNGDAMQVDSAPLPDEIAAKVDATREKLSKTRRKRPVPEDWATADDISNYTRQKTSGPLYPGGTTLAMHEGGDLALVGGKDGIAGVYSLSQEKILTPLKGGGGSITGGTWAGSKVVISTSTGRVKVFQTNAELASFEAHAGDATAVALHPCGEILASVGADKSYVLYDLASNEILTQVYSDSELTCVQFHPDGHLLAAGGKDGEIKIFDVKSGSPAANFKLEGPVRSIFFSENGTWIAALTQSGSAVSIWDLRKSAEIRSLEIGSAVEGISWDYTGQFLVAVGPGGVAVEHYSKATKDWAEVLRSAIPATSVAFGESAQSIVLLDSEGSVTTLGAEE